MAKNKGGEGKGETKTIAWREEQKTKSKKPRIAYSGNIPSAKQIETVTPTLEVQDLILGNVATGHNVQIGDVVYGAIDAGYKLTLVSAATGELAKFVGKAPHVFITVNDLVMDEYRPRLAGKWGDQQVAMWKHIGDAIGDDDLDALKARLEKDRETRHTALNAEREAAIKAAQFVGENPEVWANAMQESRAATAFEKLTFDQPVEIRYGNDPRFGVVLGFFYEGSKDGIAIHIGHVGEKSKFSGKLLKGPFLQCAVGKVPETLSAGVLASFRCDTVKAIHQLVLAHSTSRDGILNAMYHAAKRVTAERRANVVAINSKQFKLQAVPANTPAPVKVAVANAPAAQPTAAEQPAPAKVAAPVVAHATNVQDNGLNAAVAALVMASATPEVIAQTIAAYQALSSNQSNTKSA